MSENRKTIKELIEDLDLEYAISNLSNSTASKILQRDILKLCLEIRENTLKEAASNADADYTEHKNGVDDPFIEVYVINSSILNLPKDSIQIHE